jgi:hypothetical protein
MKEDLSCPVGELRCSCSISHWTTGPVRLKLRPIFFGVAHGLILREFLRDVMEHLGFDRFWKDALPSMGE